MNPIDQLRAELRSAYRVRATLTPFTHEWLRIEGELEYLREAIAFQERVEELPKRAVVRLVAR